jgi:hypothetical protein
MPDGLFGVGLGKAVKFFAKTTTKGPGKDELEAVRYFIQI